MNHISYRNLSIFKNLYMLNSKDKDKIFVDSRLYLRHTALLEYLENYSSTTKNLLQFVPEDHIRSLNC